MSPSPDWLHVTVAAEEVAGEYVWGVYDLLLLPPSFPYGGMENPCLTFVTPTLLAGDRSLVNVVAHEIAHSWTGNLVTNATWEHFWLNEGTPSSTLSCCTRFKHTVSFGVSTRVLVSMKSLSVVLVLWQTMVPVTNRA